ncbi:hypothetical protein OTBS_1624 [Orientia tsutsugamushi str. Boryong]|uniref:Uncharacterized protein n=1 Tax=Orientia tsutsugamushi (strain Boryong) TaxID=357244 RepID=A5CER8_ORITB|nr:hypothetical protein OTBS_1624 [Orientia tsutsugamushi str. Boryong]
MLNIYLIEKNSKRLSLLMLCVNYYSIQILYSFLSQNVLTLFQN